MHTESAWKASIEVVPEQQSFVNTTIVEPSPKTRIYLMPLHRNEDLIDLFPPLESTSPVEKSLPSVFNLICRGPGSILLHSCPKQRGLVRHNRVYQSWTWASYSPDPPRRTSILSTLRKRLCSPKLIKSRRRSYRTLRSTSAASPDFGCCSGAFITALDISSNSPSRGKSHKSASGEPFSIAENIETNLSSKIPPVCIFRKSFAIVSDNGSSCHLVLLMTIHVHARGEHCSVVLRKCSISSSWSRTALLRSRIDGRRLLKYIFRDP